MRPFPRKARMKTGSLDARRIAARQLFPLGLSAMLVWLMRDSFEGLDLTVVRTAFATVNPGQWIIAAIFTAVSFTALGHYDAVVHRLLQTTTHPRAARRSGLIAIAVAQMAGFGVLTGALVRWRMLPEISLPRALGLALTVSATFMTGWAVVAGVAVLAVPLPDTHLLDDGLRLAAIIAVASAPVFALLSLLRPAFIARIGLPPLRAMGAILFLTAIDTLAAGLAFHAVLPPEIAGTIPLATLLTAYLVALGAGLLSGTPGGVGPFEVTLIALLPHVPAEPLLAAVLAFRMVYYVAPALLGAALVLRGPGRKLWAGTPCPIRPLPDAPSLPIRVEEAVETAPRAEAALLRQGRLCLLEADNARPLAMVAPSGQSLILLADPLSASANHAELVETFGQSARRRYLAPFLYKAGGRLAAAARRAGWLVAPIACEAWIAPAEFNLDGAERRQIRRKLRKAQAAGVTLRALSGTFPLDEMNAIAALWTGERGGERGFSMGRYDPALLPHARVYGAWTEGRMVGFITVHANRREQTLDLMRQHPDAPEGTMHLLVAHAIEQARADGCPRFSLAAVPMGRQQGERRLFCFVRAALDRASGAAGLRQFKTSFAPRWEVLYIAAPGPVALMLGSFDTIREIMRPAKSR